MKLRHLFVLILTLTLAGALAGALLPLANPGAVAVILATIVWTGIDAANNKVPTNKDPYSMSNGAAAWVLGCLLLWIVFFPGYLIKRRKVLAIRKQNYSSTPYLIGGASVALVVGVVVGHSFFRHERPNDGIVHDGIVHLELWQPFNFEETTVFKQIMADFEKDYEARHGKKIKVDVQYVAYGDMFTKLRTAALANITPDVAFLDSIKATDLALGQALVPIDELPAFKERYGTIEKAREEFVPGSFDAGVVNRAGKVSLYGYPVQSTTVALFWNKEMFRNKAAELRAAGLSPDRAPEDWDEMLAYGKVLTEKDGSVFGLGMSSSLWFNFPIFNMYGVDFVKYAADGRATPEVDTPNGKAALARMQSIALSGIEGGAWKRSALGPEPGFINRRYAMAMTGPWNVENFSAGGLEFDIALIPQPTAAEIKELGLPPRGKRGDGRDTWSSSNIGGQTGVILRSCEERDAAVEVLEYFTSEPVQRRWASTLGQIPTRKAAWKDLDMSKYPYMKIFMEQIALSKRIPQIPLYATLENDVFNPQMDLLLQNKQTPESMLKKMDAIITARILSNLNEALEGLKAK